MTFAGAVLCGGDSRRMGRDKALVEIQGVPMAMRVATALRDAGAQEVVAVGGDADRLAEIGLAVVPDDRPGEGPLAATLTALRHLGAPVVVVLACDLVTPTPAAVRALVEALTAAPPGVLGVVPVADGVRQWAHVAWRHQALGALEAARANGCASLRRATAGLELLERHDLDPAHLADADRPDQLPGHGGAAGRAG